MLSAGAEAGRPRDRRAQYTRGRYSPLAARYSLARIHTAVFDTPPPRSYTPHCHRRSHASTSRDCDRVRPPRHGGDGSHPPPPSPCSPRPPPRDPPRPPPPPPPPS